MKLSLDGLGPNELTVERLADESHGIEFKFEIGGMKLRSWYPAVITIKQARELIAYLQQQCLTNQVSSELDQAIDDELKNKPKDIME